MKLSNLEKKISSLIKENGPITFPRFMDMALYGEKDGYYMGGEVWGRKGDYITSLDFGSIFPNLIAKEVYNMWLSLDKPQDFTVIEAGAGRGYLGFGILRALKERYNDFYEIATLILIEKNIPKENSIYEEFNEKFKWLSSFDEIKEPITGVIISNELIDAMPVHRVVMRDGLREIYVDYNDELGFFDVEGDLSNVELSNYFNNLGVNLKDGYNTEVNLNMNDWLKDASKVLDKGFILTIDYGHSALEYFEDFKDGTFMCYIKHTVNDNPYVNIGTQDMTSHVDFTSFKNIANSYGLSFFGYTTERYFFMGLDIEKEFIELEELTLEKADEIAYNQSIKDLLMPGGKSDKFKVMLQYKNIDEKDIKTKGFSFKNLNSHL